MATLYEITDDLMQLQELLESGEYTEEELADTLEAVQGEFEIKAEAYGKVTRNMQADADALDVEIKRLTERKTTIEHGIKRLKESITNAMRATGQRKIKTPLFGFTIAKNGGKQPLVLDMDPEEMPDAYRTIIFKADNDAIRKALDDGTDPLISAIAHYEERGEHLVIR